VQRLDGVGVGQLPGISTTEGVERGSELLGGVEDNGHADPRRRGRTKGGVPSLYPNTRSTVKPFAG
jgi:hypothetical protein